MNGSLDESGQKVRNTRRVSGTSKVSKAAMKMARVIFFLMRPEEKKT